MYKGIIRPVLFLIDPEKVHHLVVFLVKFLHYIPGLPWIINKYLYVSDKKLSTVIAGMTFENRIGLAAGFDKNAEFFNEFSVFGFSFIEIGTVTPLAQPGNTKPRLFRIPESTALVNRMGFNNKGVSYAVSGLKKRRKRLKIGGNIGKNTLTLNENAADDYYRCLMELYDHVDYFAINVSCPNIKDLEKLQDQESLRGILLKLTDARKTKTVYKPFFLKISPDLTYKQLDETISLYFEVGLDGIIATNTTTDRSCLDSPVNVPDKIGPGGLSGKPLKERSLQMVSYICKQSEGKIPVIGVGGIMDENDAIDMIRAGASVLQVYTGFIYNGPLIVRKMNKAISAYLSSLKKD